jgi:putative heme iron utilization protein
MIDQLTPEQRIDTLNRLLSDIRVASLSTLHNEAPFGSMVPFMWDTESPALYVHVSRLAHHTRHMDADPRVAVLITEADSADKNPLALVRVCLTGTVFKVARDDARYESLKTAYMARFPESAMIFQLPDFAFFGLKPDAIHLVAGFGQAYNLALADLTPS